MRWKRVKANVAPRSDQTTPTQTVLTPAENFNTSALQADVPIVKSEYSTWRHIWPWFGFDIAFPTGSYRLLPIHPCYPSRRRWWGSVCCINQRQFFEASNIHSLLDPFKRQVNWMERCHGSILRNFSLKIHHDPRQPSSQHKIEMCSSSKRPKSGLTTSSRFHKSCSRAMPRSDQARGVLTTSCLSVIAHSFSTPLHPTKDLIIRIAKGMETDRTDSQGSESTPFPHLLKSPQRKLDGLILHLHLSSLGTNNERVEQELREKTRYVVSISFGAVASFADPSSDQLDGSSVTLRGCYGWTDPRKGDHHAAKMASPGYLTLLLGMLEKKIKRSGSGGSWKNSTIRS